MVSLTITELLLAGVWVWLIVLRITHSGQTSPAFQTIVGGTMVSAIGGLLGLGGLFFIIAAKSDRADRSPEA